MPLSMKYLRQFALASALITPGLLAAAPSLDDKSAFIADLVSRMTLEEKVGQLRLISIGGDMPRERIREGNGRRAHRRDLQLCGAPGKPPDAGGRAA
jgi:beta-glucosidase